MEAQEVFAISAEGYKLLNDGVSSRTLRRFLLRQSSDGIAFQSFGLDGLSSDQLASLARYAVDVHQKEMQYFPENACVYQGLSFDAVYGVVANSYALAYPIATASLAQLKDMLKVILVLSDSMHEYRAKPNETAFIGCNDYVYRCLEKSDVQDLWYVSGIDTRDAGIGVLEWCTSEADAIERQAIMSGHVRFKGLQTGLWERDKGKFEDLVLADINLDESWAEARVGSM